MNRFAYVRVTFTDGTTERVGGTEARIWENQLVISTTHSYGPNSDVHYYPLANIREWHWEDR